MSREHPLIKRIQERIATKRSELAELRLRESALEEGIKDDEDLLAHAKPKVARARKAAGKVETLGNELSNDLGKPSRA